MIGHYMNSTTIFTNMIEQARYFQMPIGNFLSDPSLYACDLFYARHLAKNNHRLSTVVADLAASPHAEHHGELEHERAGDSAANSSASPSSNSASSCVRSYTPSGCNSTRSCSS